MNSLRLALAGFLARTVGFALRIAGSGGTSAPGKLLLALAPAAITQLSTRLARGCAVISATNGKTTTSAIVAEVMRADGATLVHNRAGANMAGGIAATLNDQKGDFGLFELDEFWLPSLVEQLRPRAVLMGNLFRDQLDRYGELDQIVDRWREVARSASGARLVLNADDPLIAGLGADAAEPLYFGLEDADAGSTIPQHAAEQACCTVCGEQFVYTRYFVGHLGHYSCPQGHGARPTPEVSATDIELDGLSGSRFVINLPGASFEARLSLPGLYNVYNAVAAAALAFALGVPSDHIRSGIEASSPAFGRAELLEIDGRDCSIMLIKNPAGTNEVLRTLCADEEPRSLLIALNDQIADGRDISWIWDADFEALAETSGAVICSGVRAVELALRLKYAGVEPARVTIEPDLGQALQRSLASTTGRLVILPTYTAMLEVRELLVSRGAATGSFA